ncbi:MAG: sulfite exporter TauE/SafE family protein [Sulfuriferula sp.]
MEWLYTNWPYTMSGLGVGFIVGVTGMGGGALMTPLLVLVFGVAPSIAVGTDLLYASFTKMAGSVAHGRRGTVDWHMVKLLTMGSLPAAILCSIALHKLALDEHHLNGLVAGVMGVALLLTATALLLKPFVIKIARRKDGAICEFPAHYLNSATVTTGVILGVLVTISSIGAGVLGTVVLWFLYPRIAPARLVGTDIAHAVPLTLVAGLGHAAMGTVNYALLGSLLMGSVPGIFLGSHLGAKIPERVLRNILATMLLILGSRLMLLR